MDLNRAAEQACRILFQTRSDADTDTPSPYTNGYRAAAYAILAAAGFEPENGQTDTFPILVLAKRQTSENRWVVLAYAGPEHRYVTWMYNRENDDYYSGHYYMRLAGALADFEKRCLERR